MPVTLFHGTLLEHVPAILERGIERGEGWGGAGTSGAFLSGTPQGALYWAKMAHQREHSERLEIHRFDRDHGREIDELLAVLAVQVPDDQAGRLRADEEQFEDVHADFDPSDWRQSLKVIGDVRFDGGIPPGWIVEVIRPSNLGSPPRLDGAARPGAFEVALKNLPRTVIGNYDPLTHKTVSDLVWIARHELDMYQEGQETDIRSARKPRPS